MAVQLVNICIQMELVGQIVMLLLFQGFRAMSIYVKVPVLQKRGNICIGMESVWILAVGT